MHIAVPWYLRRVGHRSPHPQRCRNPRSSPLYKMESYLHIIYAHPPVYLKPSLDFLKYQIQYKCYTISCICLLSNDKKKSLHVQSQAIMVGPTTTCRLSATFFCTFSIHGLLNLRMQNLQIRKAACHCVPGAMESRGTESPLGSAL